MNDKSINNKPPDPEGERIYSYNRELFYQFDPEKGFSQHVDYQNPDNQIIIRQSWDAAGERLEEIRAQVRNGQRSPIAWYMEKMLMEVPMLAGYMEIAGWRVRRHLKPSVFRKLSPRMLEKYATVFGITVAELKQPDFLNDDQTGI